MKKTFLLFVVLILFATYLYLPSLFLNEEDFVQSEVKAFEIEPMVISSTLETDDVEETLVKLKLAVDDAIDDVAIEEETADEILSALEEIIPVVATTTVVVSKEKLKKIIKPKRVVKKRLIPQKKITQVKKVVLVKPLASSVKKTQKVQADISLGEQNDIHTLSQSERKKFNHLEVVSTSKVFELEPEQEMKSPIKFQGFQKEIKFNDLEFVETLGVVSKSIPSIKRDE